MNQDLHAKVREIIGSVKDDFDVSQLGVDSSLEDAGLDSMDIATILIGVQETFNMKIPDEDVDSLVSIRAISDYIIAKQGPTA
jgi:acyl carrier protein